MSDGKDLGSEINRVYGQQYDSTSRLDLVLELIAEKPETLVRILKVYFRAELAEYFEFQGTVEEDLSSKDLIALGELMPSLFVETLYELLGDADPEVAEESNMEPMFGGLECLKFVEERHPELLDDYQAGKSEHRSHRKA